MNPEISKLELKLFQMREELFVIRPEQVANNSFMGRVVTLSEHIAECEKMLANARVADHCGPVSKKRTKHNSI
jgi:hypothetical protein